MPSRHSLSKWIRIASACLLTVVGFAGMVRSVYSGRAQERYFRYKYGHWVGTRWEIPPVDFTQKIEPEKLVALLDDCERANEHCPENYYFASYASQQALIMALVDADPVAFRRHFGIAEHWNRIARSRNPYDIESCYVTCRLLWETGDKQAAIAFWRDEVVSREFWNPVLRAYLVRLCQRAGDNAVALREARLLKGGNSTVRALEKMQRHRSAATTR